MNNKDLINLKNLVKKVGNNKPNDLISQPDNPPGKKEMEKKYKLNLKKMEIQGK